MGKGENGNGTSGPALHDAVAIGLTLRLPEDVLAKYAAGKWVAAKYRGEHVDDRGQQWVTVAMPVGPRVHAARADTVVAVAIVRQPDGYAVARLELPLKVAAQYAVETADPEPRGFAVDQAQRLLAEVADPT